MANMKVNDYMNDYSWSVNTFKSDFESFEHDGIEPPTDGECAILSSWMYQYIDENFFAWSCELLKQLRETNEGALAKDDGAFVYHGYVFKPYKTLCGGASTFDYISKHISRSYITEALEPDWNYEVFYEASTDKDCDIFECDGRFWIPGNNCLFCWND